MDAIEKIDRIDETFVTRFSCSVGAAGGSFSVQVHYFRLRGASASCRRAKHRCAKLRRTEVLKNCRAIPVRFPKPDGINKKAPRRYCIFQK